MAASALYWPDGLFPYGFQPSPDACTVVNALDKNRGNVEKGKSRRPTVQEDGLQRRSQVHKVVWGCKHPRLEAAFPQSFQSDVYCHRPPLAPQRRKGTVRVLSPCILCKMRVQIGTSEGPAVHVHNLWQASRGGKGGRGGGIYPYHQLFRLGSCKHPTLSCDRRQQRLREGCLLGPAGSDPPARARRAKADRMKVKQRRFIKADLETHSKQISSTTPRDQTLLFFFFFCFLFWPTILTFKDITFGIESLILFGNFQG